MVPETTTNYTVRLVTAASTDGYISTTPTSGASINDTLSVSIVTVPENDYPYGVIQLATSAPALGDPFTPLAASVPVLEVTESAGNVTVYAVRAQGTIGSVQVEFSTEDGSALAGVINPDYVSQAAIISFTDGERVKSIQLQVLDDAIPELGKQFFVNLSNPSGGKTCLSVLFQSYVLSLPFRPSGSCSGCWQFNCS